MTTIAQKLNFLIEEHKFRTKLSLLETFLQFPKISQDQ